MRHILIFPVFITLFILSLLLGGICWLYRFSKKDYLKGTRFIHSHIRFTQWYEYTSKNW